MDLLSSDGRNLAIGIISSLIASAVLGFGGLLGPAASVAAGLAVLVALLTAQLIVLLRRGGGAAIVGIERVDRGPNEQVECMFDGAVNSIAFWGVSANRTARSKQAQEAMKTVGSNGGKVRFLLLDPDSQHLPRRAADEGEDADSWASEIRSTVTRLKQFAVRESLDLEVRFFDGYPVWRMVVLDGSVPLVLEGEAGASLS